MGRGPPSSRRRTSPTACERASGSRPDSRGRSSGSAETILRARSPTPSTPSQQRTRRWPTPQVPGARRARVRAGVDGRTRSRAEAAPRDRCLAPRRPRARSRSPALPIVPCDVGAGRTARRVAGRLMGTGRRTPWLAAAEAVRGRRLAPRRRDLRGGGSGSSDAFAQTADGPRRRRAGGSRLLPVGRARRTMSARPKPGSRRPPRRNAWQCRLGPAVPVHEAAQVIEQPVPDRPAYTRLPVVAVAPVRVAQKL